MDGPRLIMKFLLPTLNFSFIIVLRMVAILVMKNGG